MSFLEGDLRDLPVDQLEASLSTVSVSFLQDQSSTHLSRQGAFSCFLLISGTSAAALMIEEICPSLFLLFLQLKLQSPRNGVFHDFRTWNSEPISVLEIISHTWKTSIFFYCTISIAFTKSSKTENVELSVTI